MLHTLYTYTHNKKLILLSVYEPNSITFLLLQQQLLCIMMLICWIYFKLLFFIFTLLNYNENPSLLLKKTHK